MKPPPKDHAPKVHAPSSGQGASSALEALIRKRIPEPAPHASPKQAPPRKR